MSQSKSSYDYYDETQSVEQVPPERPPLPQPNLAELSPQQMIEASDGSEYESFEESLEESQQPVVPVEPK